MPAGLETIANQTRSVFDAYPSIELSVLFGSVAMGNARAKSDLDIAVLPRRDASLSLMEELQLQHELSVATGLEVDIVRLDLANPLVKHEVARHGTPLLERVPGAFGRFSADAALEYLDLLPLFEQGRKRYLARIAMGHK
jgi:uncharacterized protein